MKERRSIILEGVTGAGKSRVLAELRRICGAVYEFVDEERTLGEFMSEELHDSAMAPAQKLWRLAHLLDEARARPGDRFVLERFHPSYFALLPDWSLYQTMDRELAEEGFVLALLTMPAEALSARALFRVDRAETEWTHEMVEYFGSEAAALDGIRASQERRRELLDRTAGDDAAIEAAAVGVPGGAVAVVAVEVQPGAVVDDAVATRERGADGAQERVGRVGEHRVLGGEARLLDLAGVHPALALLPAGAPGEAGEERLVLREPAGDVIEPRALVEHDATRAGEAGIEASLAPLEETKLRGADHARVAFLRATFFAVFVTLFFTGFFALLFLVVTIA